MVKAHTFLRVIALDFLVRKCSRSLAPLGSRPNDSVGEVFSVLKHKPNHPRQNVYG